MLRKGIKKRLPIVRIARRLGRTVREVSNHIRELVGHDEWSEEELRHLAVLAKRYNLCWPAISLVGCESGA